jgi:hypothetical protein
VACYLRSQSAPYPRTFRRGVLEVGGQTATWKRAGPMRAPPPPFAAEAMSVLQTRQLGPGDQRFGEPRAHLFAVVHCAAPAGSIDMAVPIADLPLITWFFGGQQDDPESALPDAAIVPAPRARPVLTGRQAWALVITGCVLMLAAIEVSAGVPRISAWMSPPGSLGVLLAGYGIANIVRRRRAGQTD